MKISLEFETNTAAFGRAWAMAVRSVLLQASRKAAVLRRRKAVLCTAPEEEDKLRDINGNTIGWIKVEE